MADIIIWDAVDPPSKRRVADETVIFWRAYSTHGFADAVSIPKWVEAHANSLRDRYLAWIYDVGETVIRGKRLVDHFQIRPGFSAWWMSLLVEKCNFSKSPYIDDAVRLLAFTDWVNDRAADRLVLVSSNGALAESLQSWCNRKGIDFEWQPDQEQRVPASRLRRFHGRFPKPLQALIWLARKVQSCWALRDAGKEEWRQSQAQITFVSYLFNLAPDAASKGVFKSGYWGNLPETLHKEGVKTNWLHLYVKDSLLPTAQDAAGQIRLFNQAGEGRQNHVTLESFLSMAVLGRVLRDWFVLLRKGRNLQMREHTPRIGELDLWPLFRDDWHDSVSGVTAVTNALYLNLFEVALSGMPKQRTGVYLLENQGWEAGLGQAWKSNGHEETIGCAHSTVRFWDLRYFYDQRSYRSNRPNPMPMPDRIAVNGPAAREACIHGGCPEEKLVDVEALRFLYLNQLGNASRKDGEPGLVSVSPKVSAERLLVVCDYMESHTRVQMQLLNGVADHLPDGISITVKPHPAMPVSPKDYPELSFSVSSAPIAELLAQADVVYTGAVTSAAVDAYCAGLPVVTVLDQSALNMSPLRGCSGVTFVGTSAELASALREAVIDPGVGTQAKRFFNLNKSLPRWKELLGVFSDQ